ncbi:mannitol dehydrogenase family protein [Oceaniglobus trochenteri]|uniref:mannitol dehydrogenase family protein n=1 Tax=Oceaniglobus trochenteri TaxID=2763260 RepID=UPI001CFF7B30|nr:mannitol dehydrogenase family protein [Oceaniglobus trochenteri]
MAHTPILQFGTSRFLQAHADLFISEAGAGPITVVQSSGDPARAHRLAALAEGFPVRIEGISEGETVQREVWVNSVARTASSATDWDEITRIACEEAEIILSNTGDKGFAPQPADGSAAFDQAMSYPAKLMLLLKARFDAGAAPIQVMPTELITDNGAVLRDRVLELAGDDGAFRDYLETGVLWVNSLVDRIVSAPLEPAGAVAEPYALWAIEDQPGLRLPCTHPAVEVVGDLAPIAALKLFVLNLGHTYLADRWQVAGGDPEDTVARAMADPERAAALSALYRDEVRPGFAAAGMAEAFDAYVATTMERFANPFLAHRIADIAQNHDEKVARRIDGFRMWAAGHGDSAPRPILDAICGG